MSKDWNYFPDFERFTTPNLHGVYRLINTRFYVRMHKYIHIHTCTPVQTIHEYLGYILKVLEGYKVQNNNWASQFYWTHGLLNHC